MGTQLTVSDNGTSFTSSKILEFFKKNGNHHVKSAPYHPASIRLAECYVQTFKPSFKKSGGDDLQQQVSQCLFQYRSTPLSTTGVPPAQLLMGRCLQTRLDLMCPSVSLLKHVKKLVTTSQAMIDSSHWVTQCLFGTSQLVQHG